MEQKFIKPPVEIRYREELEALKACDTGNRPENWQMSRRAILQYRRTRMWRRFWLLPIMN